MFACGSRGGARSGYHPSSYFVGTKRWTRGAERWHSRSTIVLYRPVTRADITLYVVSQLSAATMSPAHRPAARATHRGADPKQGREIEPTGRSLLGHTRWPQRSSRPGDEPFTMGVNGLTEPPFRRLSAVACRKVLARTVHHLRIAPCHAVERSNTYTGVEPFHGVVIRRVQSCGASRCPDDIRTTGGPHNSSSAARRCADCSSADGVPRGRPAGGVGVSSRDTSRE